MKITLFGATGALGQECLKQALAAGHEVTALVRSPDKLPAELASAIQVIEGDALDATKVAQAIQPDTDAVLFAIGVDKQSPPNLCTDVTRHIFQAISDNESTRFIWCGGGSTFVDEDQITFGARIVRKIAELFMSLRHNDKEHQYQLLSDQKQIDWYGVRPLQMKPGQQKSEYRLGFDPFSASSTISFSDCAHAMLTMLKDDTWRHKAPIIQY